MLDLGVLLTFYIVTLTLHITAGAIVTMGAEKKDGVKTADDEPELITSVAFSPVHTPF